MKRSIVGILSVLAGLGAFCAVPGMPQESNSPSTASNSGGPPLANPLKLALLRWYKANTVFTMFPVGKEPIGIAFDGANVWTANWNDGTVTKLQANDGTVLGTFSSGGAEPYGVTFDGANIWVSNLASNNVTKLRASDGKLVGTFTVGCSRLPPHSMGRMYGWSTAVAVAGGT